MEIIKAEPQHFDAVRRLFMAYKNSVAEDGSCECFGGFEDELANLPGDYADPYGIILLLVDNKESMGVEDAFGCVAIKPKEAGSKVAEIKRLFIQQNKRANGSGQRLLEAVKRFATQAAYDALFLETVPSMSAAIKLYEKNGFVSINQQYKTEHNVIEYYQLMLNT